MLQVAGDFLRPRFGESDSARARRCRALASGRRRRCHLQHGDVSLGSRSRATLQESLRGTQAWRPGRRAVRRGPNIARLHDRAAALMREPTFAPYFTSWQDPWEFADTATTNRRLEEAGFEEIRTSLVPAPLVQPDAQAFQTFITTVICRPHLAHLARSCFAGRLRPGSDEQASGDNPPFELDYWRLNIEARKPADLDDDDAAFELLERSRPVFAQQPRERPIRQQAAAGLTRDAVVGFVRRVRDSLHRRTTHGTWLAVAAMNGHPFAKGRHLLRKLIARLRSAVDRSRPREPNASRRTGATLLRRSVPTSV